MFFALRVFVITTIIAILLIEIAGWMQRHRQDLPWTEVDLKAPPGRFTAARIAELGSDAPRCRAILARDGGISRPAPDRLIGRECGYRDGTSLRLASIQLSPAGVITSCPVAAAAFVWEEAVQREARARFGSPVVRLL